MMFVIFALGDVTGRIASSWGPWGRRPPAAAALLVYSLLRLGVVAALLVCHVVTPSPWQLPVLLSTDYWPLGLVLALGLTQGHLLSTACMHAPAVLPPGKEATFGPVTGFCITAGCLGGSVASTLLVERFTLGGGL
jgi:equilibrative nucleoside transporter 1/2/3